MNEDSTREMPEPTNAQIFALLLEMKAQMVGLERRMDSQQEEITALREKVELRFYDTRPHWEQIAGEIGRLNLGQQELRGEIEGLRVKVEELRVGQEELRIKIEELDVKVERVRQDLAAFRAETNHNLKLINHKFKDVFADIADVSARTSELERHFPIVEN
ncbi:MAG: Atg14 domain-containing protein [Acidobacteria bacterium]|nr:Atg14 domain-containing protein [Acidobacteriota bacterium]